MQRATKNLHPMAGSPRCVIFALKKTKTRKAEIYWRSATSNEGLSCGSFLYNRYSLNRTSKTVLLIKFFSSLTVHISDYYNTTRKLLFLKFTTADLNASEIRLLLSNAIP